MNIYESIAAIQTDVDFIGKDKTTQSGSKFKYRGVDQVLNTLHPSLQGIRCLPCPRC